MRRGVGRGLRLVGLWWVGAMASLGACQAPAAPDAAERAACRNALALEPCMLVRDDEDMCVDYLTSLREETPSDCLAEHEQWVACITALTECPSGAGILCPAEFSERALCAMGRP